MKPKLIAEVSSNHNQDLERAKQFIKIAAESGCDAVKFQLFKIDQLFSPDVVASRSEIQARRQWELPLDYIPELYHYAHEMGIQFGCTPFYLDAVQALDPYVDFFKIASYELLWLDLFKACGDTGKPFMFSTGMANMEEVNAALQVITHTKTTDITVLKCTSNYPTDPKNVHLESIQTLRNRAKEYGSGIKIGLSDHTRSIPVVLRAVHKYNVSAVEFHLDIDQQGVEYGPGHCWLPEEVKQLRFMIDDGFLADGSACFEPTDSEQDERNWRADPSDGLRPLKFIRK
jgi:sialic acid synthase SpsE